MYSQGALVIVKDLFGNNDQLKSSITTYKTGLNEHCNSFTVKMKSSEVIFYAVSEWNARWHQLCLYEMRKSGSVMG